MTISLAFALSSALLVVSFASGQVVERVQLMEAGRTLTAGLPPGVFLLLISPPEYTRAANGGSEGSWVGPEYRATGQPNLRGRTSIEWKLRFDSQSKNSEDAAPAALDRGWERTVRGGISVPHVIGGRDVGTFDGDFVLTVGPASADASYEAAMAFPIAPRLFAVVNFFLTGPATSSAGSFGEYVVMDTVGASTWNRGQAFRSMAGIRIEGNLPPTRVLARGGAGRVTGSVADAFRHPLVGARVVLERRARGGWVKLTSTKTSTKGTFSIRVGARAQYRAIASLGTISVTSAAVSGG